MEVHSFLQEKQAHKNVYIDVWLNFGWEKYFQKLFLLVQTSQKKRLRVAKTQQELDELDDESTDIYK